MAASSSKTLVLIAMGANAGIAVAKFVASGMTGSSAMLSEAIHSVVDTCNQALLLLGLHRAKRPADAQHPFGYSRELYFWSFIVAILLFSLGAGVALYEGYEKLIHPHPISNPEINYAVLMIAIGLEGYSTYMAVTEFNRRRGERGFVRTLQTSKDPALFAIVLEDIAALTGLFFALFGVMAAHILDLPQADGIASLAIGVVLATVAAFMSFEIKALIIGEAANKDVQAGLKQIILEHAAPKGPVTSINEIRTMHLGPDDVLVAASVDLDDQVTARTVKSITADVEQAIKQKFPEVRRLFLEVQAKSDHEAVLQREALDPEKPLHIADVMP